MTLTGNATHCSTPVIGFIAPSGTGKTTLLEQVIRLLCERSIQLAVIKHTHHDFEMDTPGKDSYRLRKAGAQQTLLAGRQRQALITESPQNFADPDLSEMIARLDCTSLNLILVEGFKDTRYPKIALHRSDYSKSDWSQILDDQVIAVASDAPNVYRGDLPVLDLNNPVQIVDFLLQWINSH